MTITRTYACFLRPSAIGISGLLANGVRRITVNRKSLTPKTINFGKMAIDVQSRTN